MTYEEKLAAQIAEVLKGKREVSQKKMFGGLCFLLNGNMLCGIAKGKLVARVGPDHYEKALRLKNTAPMDFTGKPLKGMVYVLPEGTKSKTSVKRWVEKSVAFVQTLPKKNKG